MPYFITRNQFLVPSFELSLEEKQIFNKFLLFLENSGVGKVIERYVLNNTKSGGRPNVNYYNLFAAILFGFAFGKDSLRDLEDACSHDIRYIEIMEQVRPSYTTFAGFINKVIVPNETEIFSLINNQIIKELGMTLDDVFIDGSKFEANANKYKFVWKPITFHKKLSITFFNILKDNKLCEDFHNEDFVSSKTVALALNRLSINKNSYDTSTYNNLKKSLENILFKTIEYEEKENICGTGRKSYYKTDKDATAMCLKADYYSGLGTNMHAAYSTQISVCKGIVCTYLVSQSRTDINEFIPVLKSFFNIYGQFPTNVCADAGYGSLENYKYLKENQIGNYVKHQSWEGNASGRYPDSYRYDVINKTIICLNGKIGYKVIIEGRHPKKEGGMFYKIDGCNDCKFKDYCMRFVKNKDETISKIFEINPEFLELKQKAEENLLSPKGIELRVNRSIQVEGIYGIEKQDKKYTRVRRRGINNVSTEMMLVLLGINIKKLFNYYKTQKFPTFWEIPKDLEAQEFKKPSAKRLSKKGIKINENNYKNKQA